MINEEELNEFIEIYTQDYGRRLNRQEALEVATRILGLFKVASN